MHIRDNLIKAISTFCYIGYLPLAPGTFGSMAGLGLFYILRNSHLLHMLSVIFILVLGFAVSGKAEEIFRAKDARCIVIDEVGGMLVSLAFLPYDIRLVIAAFVVFRILDITKLYPAPVLEKLKGSIGIMGDDLAAGVYTNIILQVFWRLAIFRVS